jgi:hypothetical protein
VSFPKRTDKQTLQRLLASGKLTPVEAADVQGTYDAVLAGKELDSNQRLRANTLHNKYRSIHSVIDSRGELNLTLGSRLRVCTKRTGDWFTLHSSAWE